MLQTYVCDLSKSSTCRIQHWLPALQTVCSLGNDGGKQLGLVRHELEVPEKDRAREDVRRSPWCRDTGPSLVGCSLGGNAAEPEAWVATVVLFLIRV